MGGIFEVILQGLPVLLATGSTLATCPGAVPGKWLVARLSIVLFTKTLFLLKCVCTLTTLSKSC